MGAWGAGSFDNDAALDFATEIESVADLEAAFVAANDKGHAVITDEIDADLSCRIIVAAECIAAMRGHRSREMPPDLAERVHGFGKPSMELFDLARNNLSAVMSRSELLDLWAESDDKEAFARAITDLMERLGKPARKPGKPKARKKGTPNPSPCMFCDQPMGDNAFHMIDITIAADDISTMKQGGWVHLQCLNAALHPRHMMQTWQLDDEMLEWAMRKMEAERAAREQDG